MIASRGTSSRATADRFGDPSRREGNERKWWVERSEGGEICRAEDEGKGKEERRKRGTRSYPEQKSGTKRVVDHRVSSVFPTDDRDEKKRI